MRSRRPEPTAGVVMAFSMWLWKLWKWVARLLSGKCEIERLSESRELLETRTLKIGSEVGIN